jgi:hypothetical protein
MADIIEKRLTRPQKRLCRAVRKFGGAAFAGTGPTAGSSSTREYDNSVLLPSTLRVVCQLRMKVMSKQMRRLENELYKALPIGTEGIPYKLQEPSSEYHGVFADNDGKRYFVNLLSQDGILHHGGYFNNELDAAKAYDEKVKALSLPGLPLNFSAHKADSQQATKGGNSYKGVHQVNSKFESRVSFQNKAVYLGLYKSAAEAAFAYNEVADLLGKRECNSVDMVTVQEARREHVDAAIDEFHSLWEGEIKGKKLAGHTSGLKKQIVQLELENKKLKETNNVLRHNMQNGMLRPPTEERAKVMTCIHALRAGDVSLQLNKSGTLTRESRKRLQAFLNSNQKDVGGWMWSYENLSKEIHLLNTRVKKKRKIAEAASSSTSLEGIVRGNPSNLTLLQNPTILNVSDKVVMIPADIVSTL